MRPSTTYRYSITCSCGEHAYATDAVMPARLAVFLNKHRSHCRCTTTTAPHPPHLDVTMMRRALPERTPA